MQCARVSVRSMLNRFSSWFGTRSRSTESDEVRLPPDLPNWAAVRELLQELQASLRNENISEQETGWSMQTVYSTIQSGKQISGSKDSSLNRLRQQIQSNVKKKMDHDCLWFGLLKYLRKVSRDERDKFLYTTLPSIIQLALKIEECRPPGPLNISRQQHGGSTRLSRQFVCSVMACFFLCLFPERKRDSMEMNIVNFTTFFKHLPHSAQVAKLRCVLHYFECVSERGMQIPGHIVFSRKVSSPDWMLVYDELVRCDLKLCPLDIRPHGNIEDSTDAIQVCFGNKSIGGGFLGSSRVQEEMRFSTCPELMAAMLFMENMEANEAILISGFEQFSSCTGYGDTMEFAGHYVGPDQVQTVVSIDAVSFRDAHISKQYEDSSVLRDLNKTLIGFSWRPGTECGLLQLSGSVSREAVDVAADIVTSAMTDALRQATESPVDPESKQLSHDPHRPHQSHQLEPPQTVHVASCHEPPLPQPSGDSAATSTFHDEPQLSSAGGSSVTAGSECAGHEISDSSSWNLQTAQPEVHSTRQPSSSSSPLFPRSPDVVNIIIDSSSALLQSSLVHSTDESPSSAASLPAQISAHDLSSKSSQQQLLPHEEKHQRFPTHSPQIDDSTRSSLTTSKETQIIDDLGPGTARHLLPSIPSVSPGDSRLTEPTQATAGKELTSNVFGNLTKIAKLDSGEAVVHPFDEPEMHRTLVHSDSTAPEQLQEQSLAKLAENVTDVLDLPNLSKDISVSFSLPPDSEMKESQKDLSQSLKTLTGGGYEDFVSTVDVVLSLPALQSELERGGSGLSNSSMFVNLDSQSLSTNSAEEENNRQTATELLYVNVEAAGKQSPGAWSFERDKFDAVARTSSVDSSLLEIPCSSSPQSSVSSSNVSPNAAFLTPELYQMEPQNGSIDILAAVDFLEASVTHVQQSLRRGSRDFYGELRDFLSSSSSGSRGSGSGGPFSSSSSSSWGSRSGSVSSHGTNGSTIDFPEFWSHFRRRSSQLSDNMSRRSSSSKHSSDFSTDLEDISEGIQKHAHGVIEEEGGLISILADFASHVVSMAIRNGVATGAHLHSTGELAADEEAYEQPHSYATKLSAGGGDVSEEMRETTSQGNISLKTSATRMEESLFRVISPEWKDAGREEISPVPELSLASSSDQAWPAFTDKERKSDDKFSNLSSSPVTTSSHLSPARALFSSSSPELSSSPMISCSLLTQQAEGHPSSSFNVDSGFSSAISSATFAQDYKLMQTLIEEGESLSHLNLTSAAIEEESVYTPETALEEFLAQLEVTIQVEAPGLASGTSAKGLEQFTFSESPTVQLITPSSPDDSKTLYATLESKTVYLSPENFPQPEFAVKKDSNVQADNSSRESAEIFIPLPSVLHEKNEDSKMLKPTGTSPHTQKHKSHIPKSSSAAYTSEVQHRVHKHGRKGHAKGEATQDIYKHISTQTQEASISQTSLDATPHQRQSGSSQFSGIPRHKDSPKKTSHSASSAAPDSKSKSSQSYDISSVVKAGYKIWQDRKQKEGVAPVSKSSKKDSHLSSKPHKSRYVVSDVAAPLTGRSKKIKASTLEDSTKKHSERRANSKKSTEKGKKLKSDAHKDNPLGFVKSQRFIRFVNSLAEVSLSQAVLEGAEILSQTASSHQQISDEVYNWFAGKIVSEVFLYVISELSLQQLGQSTEASTEALPLPESSELDSKSDQQAHASSEGTSARSDPDVPKPTSILPTNLDVQSSGSREAGAHSKPSSVFKVVKFKDSYDEDSPQASSQQPPAQVALPSPATTTPTFHRQSSIGSSTIPISNRYRSSLDLPSPSSPGTQANSLSSIKPPKFSPAHVSGQGHVRLTSADLSIDVYNAAATIVSQVLQTVSDSWDSQAVNPLSPGWSDRISPTEASPYFPGNRETVASNIFSSTSIQVSESPKRARRSISPIIGIFSRKPMSRETLTSAFLKVDSTPSIKSYERRSSEPCQTSVQLSLQAFNSIKFNKQAVEDKQRKISRTDDDIGRGKTWRRGSLDGFSFERRNSCGFKDPVLSRFAEELMKADTSVPELVIVGSHPGSSSTGSRRSSACGFRDTGQTNLDSEMLNTSFTSVCSLPLSHSSRSQSRWSYVERSRSRESRGWKSDSSDTEYWFPPPRIVGDEFQQEYDRQHSQEELQDYASFFAGRVVQEAVCVLKCDPEYMTREEQDVDMFAENLTDQIIRDALQTLRGDKGWQKHSAFTKSSSVKRTDKSVTSSESKAYSGEGARPKASSSILSRSKPPKDVSRKDLKRKSHLKDSAVSSSGGKSTNHTQQYLYLSLHSAAAAARSEGSRPKPSFHSVQKSTADSLHSPSKQKRHSTPGSTLAASSLSPQMPGSAKPRSVSSHQHHHHQYQQEQEKSMQRERSQSESASSSTACGVSVYAGSVPGEYSHLKKLARSKKGDHQSISATAGLSYHSELTGSPQSTSSGSESIGPTGKDTPPRKQSSKKEPPHRSKAAAGHKAERGSHKDRSRRKSSVSRRAEAAAHIRDASGQDSGDQQQQGSEQSRMIDLFASNLSFVVIKDAIHHCRHDHWLGFLSYHKPIATGNWGCGAYRGNAQLKLVIQWMAASIGQAPCLVYYTFNDRRLAQAQEIANLILGQTVGSLAAALRDYCHWVRLNLSSSSVSSFFSSSARSHHFRSSHHPGTSYSAWQDEHDSRLPRSLFDFLLEKFHKNDDR